MLCCVLELNIIADGSGESPSKSVSAGTVIVDSIGFGIAECHGDILDFSSCFIILKYIDFIVDLILLCFRTRHQAIVVLRD